MNELFTLLLMYHVICLNESWVTDSSLRDMVGYSFCAIVALNIFINFVFLFRTMYFEY